MTQTEYAQCRAAAILYRRLDNENKKLREMLHELRGSAQRVDREDQEAFALVKMNRARLGL